MRDRLTLPLPLGLTLWLPDADDETGSHWCDLSPRQAQWMGVAEPARRDCPGCILFGECARHGGPGGHGGPP